MQTDTQNKHFKAFVQKSVLIRLIKDKKSLAIYSSLDTFVKFFLLINLKLKITK